MDARRMIKRGAVLLLLCGVTAVGPVWAGPGGNGSEHHQSAEKKVPPGQLKKTYPSGARQVREVVVQGIVRNLNTQRGTFRLRVSQSRIYTVRVTGQTRVLSNGKKAAWRDVREGGRVRVAGTLNPSSGILTARVLEGFGR